MVQFRARMNFLCNKQVLGILFIFKKSISVFIYLFYIFSGLGLNFQRRQGSRAQVYRDTEHSAHGPRVG
jgi:hypothetical protein